MPEAETPIFVFTSSRDIVPDFRPQKRKERQLSSEHRSVAFVHGANDSTQRTKE